MKIKDFAFLHSSNLIGGEDRGLLRAGQNLDEVGHPAYLLPTPRQSLSSEHNI
jgi:hypothetical protein